MFDVEWCMAMCIWIDADVSPWKVWCGMVYGNVYMECCRRISMECLIWNSVWKCVYGMLQEYMVNNEQYLNRVDQECDE